MKNLLPLVALVVIAPLFAAASANAATPEQVSAFITAYKNAYETSDIKTLKSFLDSAEAEPAMVDTYVQIMQWGMGNVVTSIELVPMSPDEIKEAGKTQPLPSGKMGKYSAVPTKMLVIKFKSKDPNDTMTGSNKVPIAEKDGKLVIPMPIPVK